MHLCAFMFQKNLKSFIWGPFQTTFGAKLQNRIFAAKVARVNVKPAWYCNLKSSDCQFYKT